MQQSAKVKVQSYRDLVVWHKAMDLVVSVYELAKPLPPGEAYGLPSQLERAAVSIPANIAEGHGRTHLGDYLPRISDLKLGDAWGHVVEMQNRNL